MAISLVTQFQKHVDELFKNESKRDLLTNQDFSWTGAHSIKVYKISTATMNDYGRAGPAEGNWSRYGAIQGLDATTQEMTLTKDRSFTFAIDALDSDETGLQLQAASALARQLREVIVPEIDSYTYGVMCANAGHKPDAVALNADTIYSVLMKASEALDNAEVPEVGRVLLVTPSTYALMKQNTLIAMSTEVGQEMRLRGVIGVLDGAAVVKVPAVRLPKDFGFMLAHPSATVNPLKLEDYNIHQNPPGINGSLVEGRVCYDSFVLDNKADAIYYQEVSTATPVTPPSDKDENGNEDET